jgi:hypothetical protein
MNLDDIEEMWLFIHEKPGYAHTFLTLDGRPKLTVPGRADNEGADLKKMDYTVRLELLQFVNV